MSDPVGGEVLDEDEDEDDGDDVVEEVVVDVSLSASSPAVVVEDELGGLGL